MPAVWGSVYLEREFRNYLFCRAYENAGYSLAAIASRIGYFTKGGIIRDMWLGTRGIPGGKIASISTLAKLPLDEVLLHRVRRDDSLPIDSWVHSYRYYQKNHSIFEKKV